ncbi:hypothetical protein C1S70_30280 (plasmid) [Azospirillum argentinense]|uniref:BioF2-like acetyltransferase domain-containing protein n=1 Tax=Azospirillum argentinense TaxID=2970906 RepID=A0A2K1FRL3_9PROT|nr:GNAT family N-acetyltransferase [Azospirillum argentinense]PNQ95177.1 hypothetical protein C1S70_30280 [Azospirillum argentinense]
MTATSAFRLNPWPDGEDWDKFVAGSPQGTVFCSSAFLDALGCTVDRWIFGKPQGPSVAVAILHNRGIPVPVSTLPAMYIGPMMAAGVDTLPAHRRHRLIPELMEALLEALSQSYPLLDLSFHPRFPDLRGVQWFNHHRPEQGRIALDLKYTARIDVKSAGAFPDYLRAIRQNRQQDHLKALNCGYVVEASTDVGILDRLHDLTFARQGIDRPQAIRNLIRPITDAALHQGFGELLVTCSPSGEPVSASLFLFDRQDAYYLFGATDPVHRKDGVGTLTMLEGIRRSMVRGLTGFDMVGANSPQRGDFKTSFNAEIVPYFTGHWRAPSGSTPPSHDGGSGNAS